MEGLILSSDFLFKANMSLHWVEVSCYGFFLILKLVKLVIYKVFIFSLIL